MHAIRNRQQSPRAMQGISGGSLLTFFFLLLSCAATMSAQNNISTIVGNGTLTPLSTPAMGNYADLPGPSSVLADGHGNVYVASPAANRVYKISNGKASVFAGQGWPIERPTQANLPKPAVTANLNAPAGLAMDGNGNIFIADTGAYVIWEVSPNGTLSWLAGLGDGGGGGDCMPGQQARLQLPSAVATDAAGNVYIADSFNNRVRMMNMQSTAIPFPGECGGTLQPGYVGTVAGNGMQCDMGTDPCGDEGPAKKASLNFPQGLFVDAAGNIYISDSGDHRVRVVTTDGKIHAYAGTGTSCAGGSCLGNGGAATTAGLGNPWQLYGDSSGNLYIADALQNMIREVIPASGQGVPTIQTFAGSEARCSGLNTPPATQTFCGDGGAATAGLLNASQGVYGDASGIYIGDTGDQRVRQVAAGNINSFAGGGLSDGPAYAAMLAQNQDVALDGNGNLYIADTGNNRIREVSNGQIKTLAGTGVANYYGNNNTAATNANLSAPVGIALDAAGNVYVADTSNFVIRVLNTQSAKISIAGVVINPGQMATVAGRAGSQCSGAGACNIPGPARGAFLGLPKGLALDGAGNIYFADETEHAVLEIDTTGNISVVAGQLFQTCGNPADFQACGDGGPATSALLFHPYSVAVDGAGNIFVSDAGDNRIREVSGGMINAYAFNGITNFGPDGVPALQSEYILPEYIALDSRDNMFVSGSSLYYVIQRIDGSAAWQNTVASVAGYQVVSPKYFGYCCDGSPADGPKGAWINNAGVAVDNAERLYISDAGNNRVRLVSSSPTQGLVPVAQLKPFTPPGLQFPNTPVGSQSMLTFTVSNNGSDDLVMGAPSINAPFSFGNANPCPGNIVPPDMTCTYQVIFTPTQAIQYQGQATVNDNAFNGTSQSVGLTGTGTN